MSPKSADMEFSLLLTHTHKNFDYLYWQLRYQEALVMAQLLPFYVSKKEVQKIERKFWKNRNIKKINLFEIEII